jgi:hypothetical protein
LSVCLVYSGRQGGRFSTATIESSGREGRTFFKCHFQQFWRGRLFLQCQHLNLMRGWPFLECYPRTLWYTRRIPFHPETSMVAQ